MAVFTMLVCMGLYLHNQCVLQTNIYILSIEGAGMYADNAEHRLTSLQKIEAGLYKEKYILEMHHHACPYMPWKKSHKLHATQHFWIFLHYMLKQLKIMQ